MSLVFPRHGSEPVSALSSIGRQDGGAAGIAPPGSQPTWPAPGTCSQCQTTMTGPIREKQVCSSHPGRDSDRKTVYASILRVVHKWSRRAARKKSKIAKSRKPRKTQNLKMRKTVKHTFSIAFAIPITVTTTSSTITLLLLLLLLFLLLLVAFFVFFACLCFLCFSRCFCCVVSQFLCF